MPTVENANLHSDFSIGGNYHQGNVIYNNFGNQGTTVQMPRLLTNLVPQQADRIVGRADELAAIDGFLAQKHTTVLMNGIGGIGKSSVAAKYVVSRGQEYAHIAWLTVTSGVVEAFVNNSILVENLGITDKVREQLTAGQLMGAFDVIVHQLSNMHKTLVVLDNANDLGDLVNNKPFFEKSPCCFLITSRNCPEEWTNVPIEPLPEDEAVQVFRNITPSVKTSDKALKSLLHKLFYHTLLIELVAKSVKSAGWTFEEIERMIHTHFIHHEELNDERLSTGGHGDSLTDNLKRATIEDYIWFIFENVKGLYDSEQNILRGLTLFPLSYEIPRADVKEHLTLLGIEAPMQKLKILVERGWVEKLQETDAKPRFRLHPLIVDVVLKHLGVTVAFAEAYIERVADLISYDNRNPTHNLHAINEYSPFAERLSALFFDENREEVSELLNNLAYLEENFGFYQKAVRNKERALIIAEIIFERGHATIAVRQSNLANTYKDLGQYDRAAELLETALARDLKNFGEEDPIVAIRQSNLATVYRNLGQYDRAAELLETALESDLKNFGEEHPTVAISQSNLGNVYTNLGQYNRAAELLETALASALKNFGEEHPTVAIYQSNLGNVYRNLGQNDRAAELLETALASDLKNFGDEHPEVAKKQSNLAIIYRNLDQYDRAAELLETALASAFKNFGAEHPTVAINQNNLAWVYYETGRAAEAKALWQSAYQNYLKNLGAEHPHTVLLKKHSEM